MLAKGGKLTSRVATRGEQNFICLIAWALFKADRAKTALDSEDISLRWLCLFNLRFELLHLVLGQLTNLVSEYLCQCGIIVVVVVGICSQEACCGPSLCCGAIVVFDHDLGEVADKPPPVFLNLHQGFTMNKTYLFLMCLTLLICFTSDFL